jgi:thiosulfate/3-mercaptopyruvate sulfurtransferase
MADAYVHPEVLVSADWVAEHLDDPKVRVVESDEDVLLYDMGHIPGSVKIDWQGDLQDQLIRDYIDAEKFAAICSRAGIANDTTVVFYGDKSNWWACYALWAFKLFGHKDCRVLNGGRKLWFDQKRPTTTEVPKYAPTKYSVGQRDESVIRVFRDEVLAHSKSGKPLLDVRSPKEFTGERTHMEDYPNEGSLRGGHIPGAVSVPWARAVNDDGTFKTADELKAIYQGEVGLKPEDDIVAYCRIGERSSLTWFVLTYLLGYPKVRNYDGSWCEWGNLVKAPIAKGA